MTEADISFVDEVLEAIFRRYPTMKTRILKDYGLDEDWKGSSGGNGGCCVDRNRTDIARPDVSDGTGARLSTGDLWNLLGISPDGGSSGDVLGGSGEATRLPKNDGVHGSPGEKRRKP